MYRFLFNPILYKFCKIDILKTSLNTLSITSLSYYNISGDEFEKYKSMLH